MALKVLHVISGLDPDKGGPIAALQGLVESQMGAGRGVSVVATWAKGSNNALADRFRERGADVRLIGPVVAGLASWHPSIGRVLGQVMPSVDVVHAHGVWEEIQHRGARVAQRLGKPYVVTPHGMLSEWALGQSRLKKRVYLALRARRNLSAARALHFTTVAEQESSRKLGLPAPSFVEPLGLDLSEFEHLPPAGTFRRRWPELAGKKIVLFLGRIFPRKGLEYLVPALACVRMPEAMLVVVGPDSAGYRAQVEQMIEAHGLRGQVLFTGSLLGAEKVAALQDADLLALPSDHEKFGLGGVEALAAGTPVLISDQVNICGEIAAGGVGAVVPIDVEKIARELRRWLSDESLRGAAAARARPFVWEHYDRDRIARNWVRHYERVVAGG